MAKFIRVKEFGKRVYLTFKVWLLALVGVLVLSVMLGTGLLFFIPLTARYALVAFYLLFTEIMAYPLVRLFTVSTGQIASNLLYNRKHKPKEYFLPNAKQIAEKMRMNHDKPIYVTDNPSVTGPFTNLFSRKIYFPSFMLKELHTTENEAGFGHELAHVKYRRRFLGELLLASIATWVFAMVLAYFAISLSIYVIAQFAFMMLAFSFVLRRNESLADRTGGNATTPEALISLLDYFRAKCKGNGSGITHPSFNSRIKRLERLFEEDRR
jgi:Zn-dependent protease with chaperone function